MTNNIQYGIIGIMKVCVKCKIQKPLANFSKDAVNKDGLQSWCRQCKSRQAKLYSKTLSGYLRNKFSHIKQRCNNPKNPYYKWYGKRGIECRFTNANSFILWVTSILGYDTLEKLKGLDTDRIDNNGHYEVGNIRFVTHKENCHNRRKPLTYCPHCGIMLT